MFEPKEVGLKVDATGMLHYGKEKKFEEEGLPETCECLTYQELDYIYRDLKATRRHMLNYIHDRTKVKRLSLDETYERWGQINSLEAVIRFIRDVAYQKGLRTQKENQDAEQD
jgi:hypothetical protein